MPTQVRLTRLGVGQQLGQVRPSNTSATSAYSPAEGISAEIEHIIVCNQSGAAATFRIFHDEDGSTYSQVTSLFYDIAIAANTSVEIDTKIYMIDQNGNLGVRTDTGNALTFTVYGTETRIKAR